MHVCLLWSSAGKGLTSWLSFVMSNCDVVTFPLVSWVRCGAWLYRLYRFLIFALFFTLERIVGKPNFSDQFKKIINCYKRVGYKMDIMRQSACLVVNTITVYSYCFLFNYTTVGQAPTQ